MSTGVRHAFGNGPVLQHLARLALLDARAFDGARREMGEYLVGQVQDNLDDQRLADGSPMPQSNAAVARAGRTLIDRHHLYDSYTHQLTRTGVEVGSAMVYAAIHHFGGETGRMNHRFSMPARPVLGIYASDEQALGDFVVAEILRAQR